MDIRTQNDLFAALRQSDIGIPESKLDAVWDSVSMLYKKRKVRWDTRISKKGEELSVLKATPAFFQ